MALNHVPDLDSFNRSLQIWPLPSRDGVPYIRVLLRKDFALQFMTANLLNSSTTLKIRNKTLLSAEFDIPLRGVLGDHMKGTFDEAIPLGTTAEVIDPNKIHSLKDVTGFGLHGLDRVKIFEAIYSQILLLRNRIFEELDMPEPINRLMEMRYPSESDLDGEKRFPSIKVDKNAKKFSISRAELVLFPNPSYPRVCLTEIQGSVGYTIFLIEDDGTETLYENQEQVWGEYFKERAKTRGRGI